MISPNTYLDLRRKLWDMGYMGEYEWSQDIKLCEDPFVFWKEYAFVICNSGMKAQIAQVIYEKILTSIADGGTAADVFGHEGKTKAIDDMSQSYVRCFRAYQESANKLEFLKGLPWIGDITKYHLAKNLGHDCAKPDRHLVRIADAEGVTKMCERLAEITGDRIATVDVVIWRAANLKLI